MTATAHSKPATGPRTPANPARALGDAPQREQRSTTHTATATARSWWHAVLAAITTAATDRRVLAVHVTLDGDTYTATITTEEPQ